MSDFQEKTVFTFSVRCHGGDVRLRVTEKVRVKVTEKYVVLCSGQGQVANQGSLQGFGIQHQKVKGCTN